MENSTNLSVLKVTTQTDRSVMQGAGNAGQSSSGCTDFREPVSH